LSTNKTSNKKLQNSIHLKCDIMQQTTNRNNICNNILVGFLHRMAILVKRLFNKLDFKVVKQWHIICFRFTHNN